jgi:pyruvate dehydrogenase E2 component (dihydrolipoamide acetyltransferase)
MPKMDMDQEEVVIDQWLKKEGDTVEKGEPVIIVETDKITSEVEAPASGKLARFLYKENETAPVTKVVAYILQEGETEEDLPELEKPVGEIHQADKLSHEVIGEKSIPATALAIRMAVAEGINLSEVPSKGEKITKEDIDAYLKTKQEVNHRVETPATPAARRIAFENRIELKSVEGTGPRNRVQASDVLEAVEQKTSPIPTDQGVLSTIEPIELTSMRRRIAERLTESYQTIPHIYLTVEVDMAGAELLRKKLNQRASEKGLPNISLTTYMAKVVAICLKKHPFLNAFLEDEKINFWDDINIGIATALDEGLIVPVIHQADKLSIHQLNQQVKALTKKARDGQLSRAEIQGGTFTISNLGMFGITSFTSIINPPQSAILSIGTIKRRPVVIDEEDSINVRPMMNLTLAADHRTVDGAVAANFLLGLINLLENPDEMLIIE